MATPTITTTGVANGLLLITDNEGKIHRVPKTSVCSIYDSSNTNVFRLDICHPLGEVNLVFANASEVAAAIASIDALY